MTENQSILATAKSLRSVIEAEADAVDVALTLTPTLVEQLAASGMFRLMVPQGLGGIEADTSTILDVCEELSYADGSVGWAVAQNANTMSYAAYVDPEAGKAIVNSGCAAGVFAPLGSAHKEGGGFRISGRYPFGSGSQHAAYMGCGAIEYHNGEMPPFDERGLPLVRCLFMPADRVKLDNNWDTMGLRGTGSVDFEVPEQFVEDRFTFSLFETTPQVGGPIYGLGAIQLGAISSAGWALGVARRALDEIIGIVERGRARLGSPALREQQLFQTDFGNQVLALDAARLLVHDAYRQAVAYIATGRPCTSLLINRTRAAVSYVNEVAKNVTRFAYEASGSQGLRNPSLLQRCFRDMETGGLHVIFDVRGIADMAKEQLGLDAPMI